MINFVLDWVRAETPAKFLRFSYWRLDKWQWLTPHNIGEPSTLDPIGSTPLQTTVHAHGRYYTCSSAYDGMYRRRITHTHTRTHTHTHTHEVSKFLRKIRRYRWKMVQSEAIWVTWGSGKFWSNFDPRASHGLFDSRLMGTWKALYGAYIWTAVAATQLVFCS